MARRAGGVNFGDTFHCRTGIIAVNKVAGSVVLRGPRGTFADVSTLDHREGFESGNSLGNPRGLEHLNYLSDILVRFRHLLGHARPSLCADRHAHGSKFRKEIAARALRFA